MPESQNPPGDGFLKELWEDWVREDLDYIKFINLENKVFQELREKRQDDWEIVELCREAMFENAKLLQRLKEGIEDDRKAIKELR